MSQSSIPVGMIRVTVDSKSILFTQDSYGAWLEANGYTFLQQKNTAHGELVYAISFSDLVQNMVYTAVKMPLHSMRIGVDSTTNRGINESLQDLRGEVARANGKVDQFISLIGGTFITIVVLFGLFGIFQLVKRRTKYAE